MKGHERYKVYLIALTPEQAFVAKQPGSDDGIWIDAKRVVYFEGVWCWTDLTEDEAKALGYANRQPPPRHPRK